MKQDTRHLYFSGLLSILSFSVPSLLVTLYSIPVIKGIKQPNERLLFEKAKTRTANIPFMLSLLITTGWGIGFIQAFLDHYISGIQFTSWLVLRYVLFVGIFTSLCFSISYYQLDFISRKYLFPFYFPDNKISGQKGVIHLSIYSKFIILVSSVCLLPIFMFFNILVSKVSESILSEIIGSISIIILFICVLAYSIGFLVAYSFKTPLTIMKEAAFRIKQGDFEVQIPVRSVDETGILAESMNEMVEGLKEKEYIKDVFGKAVDYRVRDYLLKGNLNLGGQIREAAILFTDIRGFTSFSEKRQPEEVVMLLNRFFEKMDVCITKNNGMINKFIGDAILAIFNIPMEINNYTDAAFTTAKDMLKELEFLNTQLEIEGLESIQIGIGIHTGEVLAGNIGSKNRMEYTVIGDAVNLASRLEGMSKTLESPLIISETAYGQLLKKDGLKHLGEITVKGRKESLNVYGI